ncbi:hypothetical protein [Embleya scabrispora]|uniref:hypothetical protein n=1 Tax=Embleya scabrispora TaxID=159449 RepID=UPI00035F635A|nr:hypothetical protein [Embleya scabrispora]MYS86553.1 hypothetical protein [Streptomyces sp. SID5474]
MFSFDDSISSRALGHPVVAVGAPAAPTHDVLTPIYNALETEWRRMFRAVPHERSNEDFAAGRPSYGAPAAISHSYAQDPPFPNFSLPTQGGYTTYGRHRGASLVPAQPPRVPAPHGHLPL